MIGEAKVGNWFVWKDSWGFQSNFAQATRLTPKRAYYQKERMRQERFQRLFHVVAWADSEDEAKAIVAAVSSMNKALKVARVEAANWITAGLKKLDVETMQDAAHETWQNSLDALALELTAALALEDPEFLTRTLRRPTINVSGRGGY